ncbi:MAG: cardiolipin synthase ClsB [Burkholderiales bacterium]|nr:cardiolipin synthase ClsB [Burkholderiales bacterium]
MHKLDFTGDNRLKLLQCGEQFFPALIDAITSARDEIYLETYIFAMDDTGESVIAALHAAVQRGVTVRLIIDWIGSGNRLSIQLQERLQASAIDCRVFNPWFRRGLTRTHRKIIVIDHQIAFVGGINIIDDLHSDDGDLVRLPFPRWDFSVAIEGKLVARIHKEIEAQWLKIGKLKILKRLQIARDLRQHPRLNFTHEGLAALVIRDNLRNRNTIQKAYLKALGNAKNSAILANPYFAPGRKIRHALMRAAQRGVDVSILLGVGEFDWQDAVTQSYYPKLLAHGVKIYEYRKTRLHAKVAVIDQEWATVGSSNFDGFSLFVNQEANVVVRDRGFSGELYQLLHQGLCDATQIDAQKLQRQGWLRRIKHRIAYSFYRLIMAIATLGQYR